MANYPERNLCTYQVMMMTKGKSDFTKVDNDNQVLDPDEASWSNLG